MLLISKPLKQGWPISESLNFHANEMRVPYARFIFFKMSVQNCHFSP